MFFEYIQCIFHIFGVHIVPYAIMMVGLDFYTGNVREMVYPNTLI